MSLHGVVVSQCKWSRIQARLIAIAIPPTQAMGISLGHTSIANSCHLPRFGRWRPVNAHNFSRTRLPEACMKPDTPCLPHEPYSRLALRRDLVSFSPFVVPVLVDISRD